MMNYIKLISIFILLYSCKGTPYAVDELDVKGFDTVYYSLGKNPKTERIIDSVLNLSYVSYCSFSFSGFFDTLSVKFSLTDLEANSDNGIPTNRYLLLKERKIKVLSPEDFILSAIRPSGSRDPNYVDVALDTYQFNIIGIGMYPPR